MTVPPAGGSVDLGTALTLVQFAWSGLQHLVRSWNAPARRAARVLADRKGNPSLEKQFTSWTSDAEVKQAVLGMCGGIQPNPEVLRTRLREAGFQGVEALDPALDTVIIEFLQILREELLSRDPGAQVLSAQLESTRAELHRRFDVLERTRAVEQPEVGGTDADTAARKLFELEITELDRGEAQAALRSLDRRLASEGAGMARRVRYEAHALRGNALQQLRRRSEALEAFQAAQALMPERANAAANLATAYLAVEDVESAWTWATRAMELDPNNQAGLKVRAQILGIRHELGAALDSASALSDPSERDYIVALIRLNNDDYAGALDAFEAMAARRALDPVEAEHMVQALLSGMQHAQASEGRLEWGNFSANARTAIDRAVGILSAVIPDADDQITGDHARLLVQRARLFEVKGEDSRRDLNKALQVAHGDSKIAQAVALAWLRLGSPETALGALAMQRSAGTAEGSLEVLYARTLAELGRMQEAIEVLDGLVPADPATAEERDLARVDILSEAGEYADAERVLEGMSSSSTSVEVALRRASALARRGERDGALALLRELQLSSTGRDKALLGMALAEHHVRAGNWAAASEEYSRVAPVDGPLGPLVAYAASLHNNGEYERVLDLCSAASARNREAPELLRVKASSLLVLDRVEDAVSVLRVVVERSPNDARARVQLAGALLRKGERASCLEVLAGVSPRTAPATEAIRCCAILLACGEHQRALTDAYEVWRRNQGDSDVHLHYASIFFNCERALATALEVDEVGVNTVVGIRRDGTRTHMCILERDAIAILPDERVSTDSFVATLIGKRAGDHVQVPGAVGNGDVVIESVRNKFVAAYQDILEHFNARFPEAQGLVRVVLADGDFSPVLRIAEEKRQTREAVAGLYRAGALTAPEVGKVLGLSAIEAWLVIISGGLGTVAMNEVVPRLGWETLENNAGQIRTLVLDPSAIIVLSEVGLLGSMARCGLRLVVPQSTADELAQSCGEWRAMSSRLGMSVVANAPGEYGRIDWNAAESAATADWLSAILDWVRGHCDLAGRRAQDSVGYRELAVRSTESVADIVWTDGGDQAVIISDDGPLRAWAASQGKAAIGVDELLGIWVNQGRVDSASRDAAVLRMLRWKYVGVRANVSTLKIAWDADGMLHGPAWQGALANVANPRADLRRVAQEVAMFIRGEWPVLLEVRRSQVVDSVMEALLQRGNWPATAETVLRSIRIALQLVPAWNNGVMAAIGAWAKRRGIP